VVQDGRHERTKTDLQKKCNQMVEENASEFQKKEIGKKIRVSERGGIESSNFQKEICRHRSQRKRNRKNDDRFNA